MKMFLRNGGKTPSYNCKFDGTSITYYPDGKVMYTLNEDDLGASITCCAVLEWQAKHGYVDNLDLEYILYFDFCRPYLVVRHKLSGKEVKCRLLLTEAEKDILAYKTFQRFSVS